MSSRLVTLSKPPSLPRLYAAALRPRRSGRLRPRRSGRSASLPDIELELDGVHVDRDHLASYARVGGFPLRDRLPVTYPHVLTFPLQIRLMTDEAFPFPLAGMVHVRNVITQQRPLDAGMRLRLRVRAERLAAHPKGAQVDLVSETYVDADPVWVSRSTYLARGAHAQAPDDASTTPVESAAVKPTAVDPAELATGPAAVWRVAKTAGRRYARVSGDFNPIHLHLLTARLFGFPGPIAHGMWTKARCLAALDARLPDALTADVSFLQPLPLPSTVRFAAHPTHSHSWAFGVLPSGAGRAHLTGTVRPA